MPFTFLFSQTATCAPHLAVFWFWKYLIIGEGRVGWEDGRDLANLLTISYPTPSFRDLTNRKIFLRNQITAICKPNNNNIPKTHQHSAVCTGGMLKGENPVSDYWWADCWIGNWIMKPRFLQEIRFL